ncbi:class I SAM-dependent methyltransferase [Lysobacter capsici]|uniref:class I SAM-dependent methyltransferase n=1 Tax=Lysobacter capsici TaxID=435897 RepID=UPI00069B858A|nr:class I SAM-dependent methyltransferase [Lysobacter capsici]
MNGSLMTFDVGQVLRKVRNEFARLGGSPEALGADFLDGGADALPRWRPVNAPITYKPAYSLGELMAYSDEAFVENAYMAILRRMPDEQGGLTITNALRSGALTKIGVLGSLRWSDEGMLHQTHIDGLLIPYTLSKWSRKRIVGPVLRWLHAVVRLGAMPQRAAATEGVQSREIHELGRLVNQLSLATEARLSHVESWVDGATAAAREEARVEKSFIERLTLVESAVATEAETKRKLEAQEQSLAPLYVQFEEAFRGSPELIRQRALPYLGMVQTAGLGTQSSPIIDIGCGNGEWLELLRDHGLTGRGIDTNGTFVESCRARGLEAIEGDALAVLASMPEASVGAVTGMHIAEHLPFPVLVRLIDECLRVIQPGGLLVLETPNPENLLVASHYFYFDPTHRNPLPPLALQWLVAERGFEHVTIERLTIGREMQVPPLLADEIPGAESVNVMLKMLHAAPDYAVVARRGE